MTLLTDSAAEAAAEAAAGRPALLRRRFAADLETPVSASLKLGRDRAGAFLLESVEGGAARGRYSVIGLRPDFGFRIRNGRAETAHGETAVADGQFAPVDDAPLDALRAAVAACALPDLPAGAPPMAAGLFGYLGFETVRLMERLPGAAAPDPLGVPDALLLRPAIVAVFDAVDDTLSLFAVARPGGPDACALLDEAETALTTPLAPEALRPAMEGVAPPEPESNVAAGGYQAMVRRCVDYIHAGDAFQIVPSQRFTTPLNVDSFSFYRALRRLNPSPFLFHFHFGGFQVIGSSPEILVRMRDGEVTIRPIAGTRPRGADATADAALAEDLLADPKELAEHLMLLDLGRNDVGRVAQVGEITIPERFVIERYSQVMHIASEVRGRVRPEVDAVDALIAGFPAGTVSGAPKIRAMEIIHELEPHARGVYSGAVGYFGADGSLDTCIALRTAVLKDGVLNVQAGAGIVADSDPDAEHAETQAKARALLRAAAVAQAERA